MAKHYYSQNPNVEHDEQQVIFEVLGQQLRCTTDAGVFSRDGLDMGTRILLEAVPALQGRILDLGCGWGPVGTAIGKAFPETEILMTDVNERAAELARRNLDANGVKNARVVSSDAYASVDGQFSAILLNPPIRAGKQVIYAMFADARNYLEEGGALYIVIRKQQGAESAEKYLKTLYADVERIAREKGYWVLRCTK